MNFERYFYLISYAAVVCGFLALWASGVFGVLGTAAFAGLVVAAWFLEGSLWQLSERMGTALIVLALPAFYLFWKLHFFSFSRPDTLLPEVLPRLILSLTPIKQHQQKGDRDWIFLYLMAFFEVLLGAGLSISALYLASFILYLLVMVCAVIAFEIRKAAGTIAQRAGKGQNRMQLRTTEKFAEFPSRRLPVIAVVLILFILALGTPLFFLLPRVGGAGFAGRSGEDSTSSGFSDTVQLGGIGRIQQNDEVVMRVRVEGGDNAADRYRWRGIALDTFDNQNWSKSRPFARQPITKDDRDLIQIDYASGKDSLVTQTVYLEPLYTSVLFGQARIVALQGNLPAVFRDQDGSITYPHSGERTSYKVISDPALPPLARLQQDNGPYSADARSYLQLPDDLDRRIGDLAEQVTENSNGRFAKAQAVEAYLRRNFGYTLELKAKGDQPLADFLFNVREGHCEYFATAMAVMLRTQGIATRIVNGFQQGDYNSTADVFVVRQRHAHSWVEVYFPKERVWVPFDPTPAAGRSLSGTPAGIFGTFDSYLEAMETFWIQYFVAFDNQEQQSLAQSVRKGFGEYQTKAAFLSTSIYDKLSAWWSDLRGDRGLQGTAAAIGYGIGYAAAALLAMFGAMWAGRKMLKWKFWRRVRDRFFAGPRASIVEFYERMLNALESKGLLREAHQTPLEFAFATGIPEAVKITEKYNRVRFGEKYLTREESAEVEDWLETLAAADAAKQ
jgi:transglutaminase-like putative cysteine protease